MSKKILITGGSGLLGARLTVLLVQNGHDVVHLGRSEMKGNIHSFIWDPDKGTIDPACLSQIDTIVHLAGAGVAERRWTPARKKEILDSRIKSTRLLSQTLKNNPHTVQALVTASAIGYYGFHDEKIFREEDAAGVDFLAQVTKHWENEADQFSTLGIRTSKLRIGIVLSDRGGALQEMARPIKWGLGSPLGSGKQFLSWIHIDDLCGIFIKAIEDEKISGIYNATTAWCTNEEMTIAIAKVLRRPLWAPAVPSFVLKIVLGEMANIVLNGSKVSSEKIKNAGFQFILNDLDQALHNLFPK